MSRYEWENGSIKLPTAAWPKFKKDLRESFNLQQKQLFEHACKLHDRLVLAGKNKRLFNYPECLGKLSYGDGFSQRYNSGWAPDEDQIERLRTLLINPDTKKPRRPLAKDFPMANGTTMGFEAGYHGHISLSATSPTIGWSVSENNHAVESTGDNRMARAFFSILGKVQWTRGSGGVIVGNDEYNQDNCEQGGGANYVTRRFGPLGGKG